MQVKVLEISGYVPAIAAMYMTNRNLTPEKLQHIIDTVDACTDMRGFVSDTCPQVDEFYDYLLKTINYGIKSGHHQILKFIDITIHMDGLHRGAQDDYDAHAARMNIIRATTRSMKGADHPELSDFYKDKIIAFNDLPFVPDKFTLNGEDWVSTPWGYVMKKHENDPDVRRGLTPLGVSSNNISKVPYGEHLQHIYDLRREDASGKKANPELREAMELMRKDLTFKCKPLGEYLGKVWVESGGGHYEEKPNTYLVSKLD